MWPVDKSNKSAIKSPERLHRMDYAKTLERASLKQGARFMEYRPETGSWVFKVDHFSKYGLDDSDEEEDVDNNKKLKTLQLEKRTNSGMMLDNNAKNIVLNKSVGDSMSQMIQVERQETVESDGIDSAASDEDMADISRHKWAGHRCDLVHFFNLVPYLLCKPFILFCAFGPFLSPLLTLFSTFSPFSSLYSFFMSPFEYF